MRPLHTNAHKMHSIRLYVSLQAVLAQKKGCGPGVRVSFAGTFGSLAGRAGRAVGALGLLGSKRQHRSVSKAVARSLGTEGRTKGRAGQRAQQAGAARSGKGLYTHTALQNKTQGIRAS